MNKTTNTPNMTQTGTTITMKQHNNKQLRRNNNEEQLDRFESEAEKIGVSFGEEDAYARKKLF